MTSLGGIGAATGKSTLGLRPPRNPVSEKAITWWMVSALISWLLVVLPQVVALFFFSEPPGWLLTTLIGSVVVGAVHTIVMPRWRYRVHRWETTGQAVYTLAGWLNHEWRVAPVSRIQTVDTERGPLQQLLGLATVTVTTASAAGPLRIAGLDHDIAVRLVDELTAVTQAAKGDAT